MTGSFEWKPDSSRSEMDRVLARWKMREIYLSTAPQHQLDPIEGFARCSGHCHHSCRHQVFPLVIVIWPWTPTEQITVKNVVMYSLSVSSDSERNRVGRDWNLRMSVCVCLLKWSVTFKVSTPWSWWDVTLLQNLLTPLSW